MSTVSNGQSLKRWRRSAGLTQKQLARLACISRATVSHVETERIRPTITFTGKVCRALTYQLGNKVDTWMLFPDLFEPVHVS